MNISNFQLSLKIKESPTLVKEISSLSILINDTVVDSITMEKLDSSNKWNIIIPSHLVNKGTNTIGVKGFLKSTYEKCELNNEINWVVIEKTSFFSFENSRIDSMEISNIFDNTYYSDGVSGKVNIALPDNLIENNYSQISTMSSLIGYIHKDKETDLNIKTLKYSDLENFDQETIVIGTVNQIKDFKEDLLTTKQWENAEKHGYIASRKVGNRNHFIVIVTTEEQLENFTKITQSKSSLSQIKEQDYILDKNKILNEKRFNTNPSLESLGYGNSSQLGNGIKTFDYYFSIPGKKTLTKNNKLTFVYNYSLLRDEQEAHMVVEINNEYIAGKKLLENKGEDKIEVTIPDKYFEYDGFNISLKFNMAPSIENCTSRNYDNIWVGIDSISSNFKLDLEDRGKYSLINSHGLLQDESGRLDGTIIVDEYNNLSIESISKISSYLGRVSHGINKLLIYEPGVSEQSSKAIFALTSSNIIKDINADLRIPISNNGQFINKDIFIQNTSSLGAIEVTENNHRIIITASDKGQLNNAIKRYSQVIGKGNGVILKDEQTIDYFGDENINKSETLEGKFQRVKSNHEILWASAVLLLGAVLIFVLYYIKVKK